MFKTIFEMIIPFYLVGCDQEFDENEQPEQPCENDINCCVTHINLSNYINDHFKEQMAEAKTIIENKFSERVNKSKKDREDFINNLNNLRNSGEQLSKEKQIELKNIEIGIINEERKIKEEINLTSKQFSEQIKDEAIKEISSKAKVDGFKYVLNTDNINQPILYAEEEHTIDPISD